MVINKNAKKFLFWNYFQFCYDLDLGPVGMCHAPLV